MGSLTQKYVIFVDRRDLTDTEEEPKFHNSYELVIANKAVPKSFPPLVKLVVNKLNTLLYLVCEELLLIYDISAEGDLTLKTSYAYTGSTDFSLIMRYDNNIYLLESQNRIVIQLDGTLFVLDVSNPAAPSILSTNLMGAFSGYINTIQPLKGGNYLNILV